jgi:hypothetical protein
MEVGGQRHAPVAFPPWKRPRILCIGGCVCMGTKNLASTGIRSPDRPFCNELLYRLRCPGLKILQHLGKEKHDRRLGRSPSDSQADIWYLEESLHCFLNHCTTAFCTWAFDLNLSACFDLPKISNSKLCAWCVSTSHQKAFSCAWNVCDLWAWAFSDSRMIRSVSLHVEFRNNWMPCDGR